MRFQIPLLIVAAAAVTATASEPVPLFNEKDLTGWWGRKTKNPQELFDLKPEEFENLKKDSQDDIHAHWSVTPKGVLVNDGKGLFLTTDKFYRDFQLSLEYKTVPKADSGIYLRGIPQVQIWDPGEEKKFKIGADKGSGGLWNNPKGDPGKDPSKCMDKPFGEWNKFDITMLGELVTVVFNGETVVENAVLDNFFERENPVPVEGPIQLQTHGGEISWRNITIREFDADEANAMLAARDADDFKPIFDGKSLKGWQGAVDNYEVKDGVIYCKAGKGGQLLTKDTYEDFALRFEFKLPPGGNNGIAIRSSGKGDPAWDAFEVQVLDDTHPKYSKLKPYQFHGSIYGLVPSHPGYLRPTGEWNFQEIICKGSHIQVILNGTTIVDADVKKVDTTGLKRIPKGIDRSSGHVGLAGHNDPVGFRNLRIKRL